MRTPLRHIFITKRNEIIIAKTTRKKTLVDIKRSREFILKRVRKEMYLFLTPCISQKNAQAFRKSVITITILFIKSYYIAVNKFG